MIIQMPKKVEYIINKLKENGYEAYAVGGCVRDSILGRIPGDWDITTSASPYEVKRIFSRTVDTGIQHGTVTVMMDKDGFEVTTYRLDGEYEDCRHPKQVEFTNNLSLDLERRDFTINAMAYNKEEGLIDLFQGLEDIKRKVIACVGSAMDRFEEDALRILRAVRFSAQLNFNIEEETTEAIRRKAKNLKNISAERIREELNKLFLSDAPEKLMIAYETGITDIVLPELSQKMNEVISTQNEAINAGENTIQMLKKLKVFSEQNYDMLNLKEYVFESRTLTRKERLWLSYSIILNTQYQDIYEVENSVKCSQKAKKVMQRLKFDNETIDHVSLLVKFYKYKIEDNDISVRKAMNEMGIEIMDTWFLLQQIAKSTHELNSDPTVSRLDSIYHRYQRIVNTKECVNLKMMNFNGKDLMQCGYKPGVCIGETLKLLLQHVLEQPEHNSKEYLSQLAKDRLEALNELFL